MELGMDTMKYFIEKPNQVEMERKKRLLFFVRVDGHFSNQSLPIYPLDDPY